MSADCLEQPVPPPPPLPPTPLALVVENSKLRAELLSAKALNAQLVCFRDRFDEALAERSAEIGRLEAAIAEGSRTAALEAGKRSDQEAALADLTARLGAATDRVDELQHALEGRDADVRARTAEAAALRAVLDKLSVAHGELQVGLDGGVGATEQRRAHSLSLCRRNTPSSPPQRHQTRSTCA